MIRLLHNIIRSEIEYNLIISTTSLKLLIDHIDRLLILSMKFTIDFCLSPFFRKNFLWLKGLELEWNFESATLSVVKVLKFGFLKSVVWTLIFVKWYQFQFLGFKTAKRATKFNCQETLLDPSPYHKNIFSLKAPYTNSYTNEFRNTQAS